MRALTLLLALGLVAPALARADAPETASSGTITATLRSAAVSAPYDEQALRLTIVRDGLTVLDAPITAVDGENRQLRPGAFDGPSLHVAQLDADPEPEVLVDAFTLGAHCCTEAHVLDWNGSAYVDRARSFGNAGYNLQDVDGDGRLEFETADDRFAYRYASYARSARPVQLLDYDGPGFRDVTGRFRVRVEADAAFWAREYHRTRLVSSEPRGPFAAWMADLGRLGRYATVRAELAKAAHTKKLVSAGFPPKRASAFVTALRRDLKRLGYLPR